MIQKGEKRIRNGMKYVKSIIQESIPKKRNEREKPGEQIETRNVHEDVLSSLSLSLESIHE